MRQAGGEVRQRWTDRGPLAAVLLVWVALWLLLFVAVPPSRQDFPLNDDWSFAHSAFAFLRGEGVGYNHWASMPQIGQWLWAWPFVTALGESHVVLRLATLVLSTVGVVAFYDLLRQEGQLSPARASLAAAALALNPLYFLLSGTYMTDVPCLAFCLVALALYARAFHTGRASWMAAASAVAVLAAVTRQNAVMAALAAGAVMVWRYPRLRARPTWLLAVLLPAAAGAVTHLWLVRRPDVLRLPWQAPGWAVVPFLLYYIAHTLGLYAAPLLALQPLRGSRVVGLAALALMLGLAAAWAGLGTPSPYTYAYPYAGNAITAHGPFIRGLTVGDPPVSLGKGARWALTALGCGAAALLMARGVRRLRDGPPPGMFALFAAFQVPLLMGVVLVHDRYLLAFVPSALALAVPREGRIGWALGLPALAASGLLSVALMHDLLSCNAARWELGRRALASGIAPADIEGGFEWDGWHSLASGSQGPGPAEHSLALKFTRDNFPHVSGRYALAFEPPPGCAVLDSEPYSLWLPPGERRFYLVECPAGAGGSR